MDGETGGSRGEVPYSHQNNCGLDIFDGKIFISFKNLFFFKSIYQDYFGLGIFDYIIFSFSVGSLYISNLYICYSFCEISRWDTSGLSTYTSWTRLLTINTILIPHGFQ